MEKASGHTGAVVIETFPAKEREREREREKLLEMANGQWRLEDENKRFRQIGEKISIFQNRGPLLTLEGWKCPLTYIVFFNIF